MRDDEIFYGYRFGNTTPQEEKTVNAYKVTYMAQGTSTKVNKGNLTVVAVTADKASSAVLDMFEGLGVLAVVMEVEALAAGELF